MSTPLRRKFQGRHRRGAHRWTAATVDGAAGRGPDVSASMSAGWTGPQFGPDRVRSRTWAPGRTASRTIRTAAGRGTPAGRAGGCAQEKPSPAGAPAVFPHGRASCNGYTRARAHNARLRERSGAWPRGWGCANQVANPLPTPFQPASNQFPTHSATHAEHHFTPPARALGGGVEVSAGKQSAAYTPNTPFRRGGWTVFSPVIIGDSAKQSTCPQPPFWTPGHFADGEGGGPSPFPETVHLSVLL